VKKGNGETGIRGGVRSPIYNNINSAGIRLGPGGSTSD